jgi:predicted ATPase
MRQALKQPVLLIVEDMHWSDDTSLEYIHYLARRCAAHPLLVLLTYRSDEVRPRLRQWLAEFDRERLAQELSLSPLTHNHVDAMLRAILDVQRPIHAEGHVSNILGKLGFTSRAQIAAWVVERGLTKH